MKLLDKKHIITFIVANMFIYLNASEIWEQTHIEGINNKAIENIIFVNSSRGYACAYFPGILRTEDGGKSWSKINVDKNIKINSLWFMSVDIGWATGYKIHNGEQYPVVLLTNDGGLSWNVQNILASKGWLISHIYFYDALNGWIIGSTGRGDARGLILSTNDGGEKWETYIIDKSKVLLSDISFANNKYGWAVGNSYGDGLSGLFNTCDGGKSWQVQNIGEDNIYMSSVSVIDQNNVWAAGGRGGIYKTTDGGKNWNKVKIEGRYEKQYFTKVRFIDKNNGYLSAVNGILLFTGDGGRSWKRLFVPGNNYISDYLIINSKIYVSCMNSEIYYKKIDRIANNIKKQQ